MCVEAHGGRNTRPVMKALDLLNKNYSLNIFNNAILKITTQLN